MVGSPFPSMNSSWVHVEIVNSVRQSDAASRSKLVHAAGYIAQSSGIALQLSSEAPYVDVKVAVRLAGGTHSNARTHPSWITSWQYFCAFAPVSSSWQAVRPNPATTQADSSVRDVRVMGPPAATGAATRGGAGGA